MHKEIEMTRDDMLALLETLGGHGGSLEEADDVMLAAIARNRLSLVTDAAAIDRALSMSLDIEWHGRLVGRRGELEQLARAAAAPKQVAPYPGMTVFVPAIFDSMSHLIDMAGNTHEVRVENGKRVVDVSPSTFRHCLMLGPNGKNWMDANVDCLARLQPGTYF